MSQIFNRARGIALALTTALAFAATASIAFAGERYPAAPGTPAATSSSSCTGPVNVQGNCQTARAPEHAAIVTKSQLTGKLRAPMRGDNDTGIITRTDFVRYGYGAESDFDAIESSNIKACTTTGSRIRQALWIHGQVQSMGPEWDQIGVDLARLGSAQNKVSWARRGFEAVATGLLCSIPHVGWAYCAGAAMNEAAGEANGIGSDKAMKVNRRQSQLNVRQSELNLAATDLWTEESIAWEEMFQAYCLQIFPDQTIGYVDKSIPSSPAIATTWGYWNRH
jgi:hypothetical protein